MGSKDQMLTPNGMILQSVENGHPIMHVELNYRLGSRGRAILTCDCRSCCHSIRIRAVHCAGEGRV